MKSVFVDFDDEKLLISYNPTIRTFLPLYRTSYNQINSRPLHKILPV